MARMAPSMRGNHFVRQWRLLHLVSRPSGLRVADGARELGGSVRTVWRDLRALEDAGLPIYSDDDEDGGRQSVWRVHTAFHDRLPFPIALDEVVALLLSERYLAPARLSPFGAAIGSLVGKLRALLAPSAQALVDRMAERVGVRALSAKLDAPVIEHLPAIHKALAEGRALRLTYFSMSLEPASLRDAIRHEVERLSALLASGAMAMRDGTGIDRMLVARRGALAAAPSRRTAGLKRNRAGASRRA